MKRISNINDRQADLYVELLREEVPWGASIEVEDDDLADRLLLQEGVWAPSTSKAAKEAAAAAAKAAKDQQAADSAEAKED